MSEVLVRNLDEAVVEQLKARGSGRSLQAALELILERAARPAPTRPPRAAYRVLADHLRASLGDRPQSDSAALLAEDRRDEHWRRTARDCTLPWPCKWMAGSLQPMRSSTTRSMKPRSVPHILWVEGDLGVPTAAIAEDFEIDLDALSRYSADEIQLLFSYHTGDRLTDADLTALSGLAAHLQELYLSNPAVTDAGMVNLRGLLNLAMLDLRGTSVTDAGLEHIGGLVGLRTLNLAETAVTDAGLAHPRGLSGLRRLVLWGTRVTDAGLVLESSS